MRGVLQSRLLGARAAWPIVRRALLSGQLFRPACTLTPPHPDVLCEYDVRIPMSEGFALTANVFRPKTAAAAGHPVPVVMCAHPYDNSLIPALGKTPRGGPIQYRFIPQAGRPAFSTLTSWESPDPNFWIPEGYAVVNLNLPGYGTSEGPPTVFTHHQARCYAEAISFIAKQPWCTGKVGLNGVSFLAITQYHVAALNPPGLACLCPWEGFSDHYQDQAVPGGVDDEGFGPFWWLVELEPALRGRVKEFIAANGSLPTDFLVQHPLNDAFWKEKAAPLEQISLPMLVCASFSDHGLHTTGSFRAFERAGSKHKWVYTHRTGKWDAFYSPEVQLLTRQFMDCFLKGDTSSGFLARAPVRLEVRSSRDVVHAVRDEQTWPLQRTVPVQLHLGPTQLQREAAATPSVLEHPARGGQTRLRLTFTEDTELTGPMKLKLWVEAAGSDDLVIFVAVGKRDRAGAVVHFFGSVGNREDLVSRGFCRVSRRALDPTRSTALAPVPLGTSEQPLKPGEVVPVEIALEPHSTFFAKGEVLELILASDEIIPSPPYRKYVGCNRGAHRFHVGGQYDAHLLVPHIP